MVSLVGKYVCQILWKSYNEWSSYAVDNFHALYQWFILTYECDLDLWVWDLCLRDLWGRVMCMIMKIPHAWQSNSLDVTYTNIWHLTYICELDLSGRVPGTWGQNAILMRSYLKMCDLDHWGKDLDLGHDTSPWCSTHLYQVISNPPTHDKVTAGTRKTDGRTYEWTIANLWTGFQ